MPDLNTTSSFNLEFDSVILESFRKCSGIASESEVIEYKEATGKGKLIIRKFEGAMKWDDITLERRLEGSKALWEWRKQVIDGDIDSARRSGSIVALDSMGNEVARWNFEAGWPSKYTGVDFDAGSNDAATESLTIVHEGLERV